MKTIKCIVIDDEQHARELIQHYIERDERLEFVKSFKNVTGFDYQNYSFDVLFLDVEMPGMNGVEFIKRNSQAAFKTIFVSAFKQYAIDGYELSITDYLLKPVLEERFTKCIDQLMTEVGLLEKADRFDLMESKRTYVMIKSGSNQIKIFPNDVKFIMAKGEYILIKTLHKKYLVYMRMREIEQNQEFMNLIRVHRSYFINTTFIDVVHSNSVIIDGHEIPISRGYKKNIMEKIKSI